MQGASEAQRELLKSAGPTPSKGLVTIGTATVLLFVVSALLDSASVSSTSLSGMLPVASVLAVAGLGQMLVVQQGGIDLSVAGALSLAVVTVTHVPDGDNGKLLPAILLAICFALVAGVVNGALIGFLGLYRTLYNATEGAMSPLVGARLENLGYDRDYTLTPRAESVDVPIWDDIMQWDGTRLTTSEPVLVDVGAAGKGYLVDLVAVVLREAGIDEYLIDASGDLLHRGGTPVRVGLEHPFDPTKAIGVCELSNAALCASAPGRRSWGPGLHHILDATTGLPTDTVAATWALASSGLQADGLATALFFAAAPALGSGFTFEYVRMFPDSRIEYSRAFPGELFTEDESSPNVGTGGSER